MNKYILLSAAFVLVASGCRRQETLDKAAVEQQRRAIQAVVQDSTWSEKVGDYSALGTIAFDLDGDDIKEILAYSEVRTTAYWWLWYYKDGTWHEMSD